VPSCIFFVDFAVFWYLVSLTHLLIYFSPFVSCHAITENDGPGGDSSKRRFGKKLKQKRGGRADDGPPQRRTTLRLGTGKKGRAAEISRRRGSLKKRDRTAEKEAKLEAATERRTVQLPE